MVKTFMNLAPNLTRRNVRRRTRPESSLTRSPSSPSLSSSVSSSSPMKLSLSSSLNLPFDNDEMSSNLFKCDEISSEYKFTLTPDNGDFPQVTPGQPQVPESHQYHDRTHGSAKRAVAALATTTIHVDFDGRELDTKEFSLPTSKSSLEIMSPSPADFKHEAKIEIEDGGLQVTNSGHLDSLNENVLAPNAVQVGGGGGGVAVSTKPRNIQKRRLALLKTEQLDRTKLKMMDLIYLNGTLNPMAAKFNKKITAAEKPASNLSGSEGSEHITANENIKESGNDKQDEIISIDEDNPSEKSNNKTGNESCANSTMDQGKDNDGEDDDDDEEEGGDFMKNMPVAQLKFNSRGEIVVDSESINFETSAAKRARDFMNTSKVVVLDENSPRPNYHKRTSRRRDWSIEETKKFYRCLQAIGTDFGLMVSFFPGRDRRSLKLKFKREERINPQLVDKAILNPRTFDIDQLKEQLAQDEEEYKQRLATKMQTAAKDAEEKKSRKRKTKGKDEVNQPKNSAAQRILAGLSVYDEEDVHNNESVNDGNCSVTKPTTSTHTDGKERKPRKPRVFKCKSMDNSKKDNVLTLQSEAQSSKGELPQNAIEINSNVEQSKLITPLIRTVDISNLITQMEITLPVLSQKDISENQCFTEISEDDVGSNKVAIKCNGDDSILTEVPIDMLMAQHATLMQRSAQDDLNAQCLDLHSRNDDSNGMLPVEEMVMVEKTELDEDDDVIFEGYLLPSSIDEVEQTTATDETVPEPGGGRRHADYTNLQECEETLLSTNDEDSLDITLKELDAHSDSSVELISTPTFNRNIIERIEMSKNSYNSDDDEEGFAALKRDLIGSAESVLISVSACAPSRSTKSKRQLSFTRTVSRIRSAQS